MSGTGDSETDVPDPATVNEKLETCVHVAALVVPAKALSTKSDAITISRQTFMLSAFDGIVIIFSPGNLISSLVT